MRIITVEEHVIDEDLTRAAQPTQQMNAPYFTEVGTSFGGNVEDEDDKRPMPIDFRITAKLSADMGAGRLAAMDKHYIDMQILSYSNPPPY